MGSAVNQDGRSSSLTAPNGPAQAALLRSAASDAAAAASSFSFFSSASFSASGGRPHRRLPGRPPRHRAPLLGTPSRSEASPGRLAAAATRTKRRKRRRGGRGCPLALAAAKSLFGHTEGAAGVHNLFAAAAAVSRACAIPLLHLVAPSAHVGEALGDWKGGSSVGGGGSRGVGAAALAPRAAAPLPSLSSPSLRRRRSSASPGRRPSGCPASTRQGCLPQPQRTTSNHLVLLLLLLRCFGGGRGRGRRRRAPRSCPASRRSSKPPPRASPSISHPRSWRTFEITWSREGSCCPGPG